jgi:hypothetical protein
MQKAEIDVGRKAEIEQIHAADAQHIQQIQAQFTTVNHLDSDLQTLPNRPGPSNLNKLPSVTLQEQEMWELFDAGEAPNISAGQNPGLLALSAGQSGKLALRSF